MRTRRISSRSGHIQGAISQIKSVSGSTRSFAVALTQQPVPQQQATMVNLLPQRLCRRRRKSGHAVTAADSNRSSRRTDRWACSGPMVMVWRSLEGSLD